jgi:hypothetical protein
VLEGGARRSKPVPRRPARPRHAHRHAPRPAGAASARAPQAPARAPRAPRAPGPRPRPAPRQRHGFGAVGPPSFDAARNPRNVSDRLVISSGRTNFVDGLAPSALNASRYWSAIVFWSIFDAAE